MRKLLRRSAAAFAAAASLALMSLTATPAAQAAPQTPAATHAGMTWTVAEKQADGTIRVSSDPQTNAYRGDTPATAVLPVLCLRVTGAPVPSSITPDFYHPWARGTVAATPPVSGTQLTSRAAADGICEQYYGPGWRMGEHHDGRYGPNLEYGGGWSFWAYGYVPENTRFWTAIDGQPANPWD
ncbi:flagellar hook-length control protein [Streptomyces botrytidirepellens]|uniref:Flagellar hook-length control protein n=1 Tax=Streptomyces botrytidirepellens TaxID=2486417 RepID=A0A3M8TT93_9ACTN|nr:flagellar hook-length control protein [Streptomyces botrytidirepellens]RNF94360.1 flagellar hook-length control protein [Streptomyces botrytidirepellens]